MASDPFSPVRMRTACSTGLTKTLPSPILPVLAVLTMASTTLATCESSKIDGIFTAAIDLGVPFLTSEAFDFSDGHAFDADFRQGFLNVFEFERFDDGFDFFHGIMGDGMLTARAIVPGVTALSQARLMPTLFLCHCKKRSSSAFLGLEVPAPRFRAEVGKSGRLPHPARV